MVTIKDVAKQAEHLRRMELAGVSRSDPDLGPAVILWTKGREGKETWEVLPKWIADLVPDATKRMS